MFATIITAIGTGLFIMYIMGITSDEAVLITSAILIVGGMIKAELSMLVDLLSSEYIFDYSDEYYDEEDCTEEDEDDGD